MIRVLSINGKWTKNERIRRRRLNRYRIKYIVGMTVFAVSLAWLINS